MIDLIRIKRQSRDLRVSSRPSYGGYMTQARSPRLGLTGTAAAAPAPFSAIASTNFSRELSTGSRLGDGVMGEV